MTAMQRDYASQFRSTENGLPTTTGTAVPLPRAPRIALAHDYLLVMRGAERTFAAIADLYADAPILTLLYDEQGTSGRFAGRKVITSKLQQPGRESGDFQAAAAAVPKRGGAAARAGGGRAVEQQQRICPWRARAGGRSTRVLLLHAISLCVV